MRHARLASDLRNNIKRLEEKLAEGAKIRSKAAFLEQNEKCSKYFFNLEKKHGQDKLIKAVRDPADRLVTDPAAEVSWVSRHPGSLGEPPESSKGEEKQLKKKTKSTKYGEGIM